MTKLRKELLNYMTLKGYTSSSKISYICRLKDYAQHYNSCPSKLGEEEIKDYLRYLIEERGCSKSTVNVAYSALKLLYVNVLNRSWDTVQLPRLRRKRSLPVVLSLLEVRSLIEQTENLKHRALLQFTYSTGMRLGEVCKVQVKDVIASRRVVFVRKGKGGKDRYTILSKSMLLLLAEYQKVYTPKKWLFEGQNPIAPYAKTSLQHVYKQAKKRAGLSAEGGLHQLRHCFATHMVEAGMDLPTLQRLLGHNNLSTTAIYLQVSSKGFDNFQHPLDD